MEKKITILLVDANRVQRRALKRFLDSIGPFRIIGEASDGAQALRLVTTLSPQIVLSDYFLPKKDAFSLLRSFRALDMPPQTILLSSFYTNRILAQAAQRGAFYCMAKPVDKESLVEQLLLAARTPYRAVSPAAAALYELGFTRDMRGFRFLEAAIILVIENDDLLNAVTKELYPAVAAQCNATESQVEADMRRAIGDVWRRTDPAVLRRYFPNPAKKPTTSAFIATLADILRPAKK